MQRPIYGRGGDSPLKQPVNLRKKFYENNQITSDINCQMFYRTEFRAFLDLICSIEEHLEKKKMTDKLAPILKTFQNPNDSPSLKNI